ncbi:thymidylate synthase [[Mycoplasma] mobile]|uniref:Thymidylate synthase n=1 Tax=Mycoplasma mobile (strain ATCC 43663 / 163K / NCTC 11711) TaxID=267748 RepID=TYSY_MYCM1|nr:thymidylate synthase [[Mycoplasma] mobile]Q6KIQ6.1 RecName: Full=Thymidylate synthase; Short=TS; Short=TSase [Mycoplasma mobile 163K]AAT27520.1 thymidylate synthase [Mycoplasma mobile 163K]
MEQYLSLLKEILEKGQKKEDRTNTGTISYFGTQRRYDLSKGFPLVTTKKVHLKSIIFELLWFIKGDTNIKYLVDNGVNIWNEWPYETFKKSKDFNGESLADFVLKIKSDTLFAKKYGELGPVYGKQWRNFNGTDQLFDAIETIKKNPDSRRIIVSAWAANEISKMALPPCHAFFQFYVNNNKLSLQLYQRSGDTFLGVPFNIASYSILLAMVAQITNYEVGEFIHTIGDTHIYLNHLEQVEEQLSRKPLKLPKLVLNKKIKNIDDFKYEDIEIIDYESHPAIKAKVAV